MLTKVFTIQVYHEISRWTWGLNSALMFNRHSNGGNQVEKTAHFVESIKSVAQFPDILPSFTGWIMVNPIKLWPKMLAKMVPWKTGTFINLHCGCEKLPCVVTGGTNRVTPHRVTSWQTKMLTYFSRFRQFLYHYEVTLHNLMPCFCWSLVKPYSGNFLPTYTSWHTSWENVWCLTL